MLNLTNFISFYCQNISELDRKRINEFDLKNLTNLCTKKEKTHKKKSKSSEFWFSENNFLTNYD